MSMPQDEFALVAQPSEYLSPDNHIRINGTYDYEDGGVALNDSSEGVTGWNWKVWIAGDDVMIARDPYNVPAVLLTVPGTTWIGLAFDQNMRANLAFVQNDVCKLYWYDTVAAAHVTTEFADAESPMLCLDDKRSGADSYNDILFFYVKAGSICYRQQRDRFSTERVLAAVPPGKILQVGMARNLRIQLRYKPE